jgi:DNA-directed RNA polymerase omega subunit
MDKPSIDDLLKNIPGMYDLAAIAARRAIEIKKKHRDITQPLQQALEEIKEGKIDFNFRMASQKDVQEGEQIELPLDLEHERIKVEPGGVFGGREDFLSYDDEEDTDDDLVPDEHDEKEEEAEEYEEGDAISDEILKDQEFPEEEEDS